MARDEERTQRAQQEPIVGGLPDVPGIGTAMRLTPGLGVHLRGLADELLVNDFPGATLRRDRARDDRDRGLRRERLLLLHGFPRRVRDGAAGARGRRSELAPLVDVVKQGSSDGFEPKMQALLHIARTVRGDPLALTTDDVQAAHDAGATDGDVQLAVLIASAFSMYNRIVDGFRARTAPVTEAYRARAAEIAENGYSAPSAIPAAPPASAGATRGGLSARLDGEAVAARRHLDARTSRDQRDDGGSPPGELGVRTGSRRGRGAGR